MPKGQCTVCGNHPRSAAHREACRTPSSQATVASTASGSAWFAAKKQQSTRKRVRRGLRLEENLDPRSLPEGWVLGRTCVGCQTKYTSWEPQFQDETAKHGKYDVTKQLPNTSRDYPICDYCLPWYWKAEAHRWGMMKEVQEVYPERFAA